VSGRYIKGFSNRRALKIKLRIFLVIESAVNAKSNTDSCKSTETLGKKSAPSGGMTGNSGGSSGGNSGTISYVPSSFPAMEERRICRHMNQPMRFAYIKQSKAVST
jgi:pectate lyase